MSETSRTDGLAADAELSRTPHESTRIAAATAFDAAQPARSSSLETRLARWLREGPLQQADGAVAGWVDADHRADYVYPEITGYYLQWLAWRATQGDDGPTLAARARGAQRWLRQWLDADVPLTRVYRSDAAPSDWRNDAVFLFDLAMVLRGLAAAAKRGLIVPDEALVARLCGHLCRLIASDGRFDACRAHRGDAALPARWSTRRGAFLAKAAAGIDYASANLPGIPSVLRRSATLTFAASLDALAHAAPAETHPLLYCVEGFLNWPAHPDFARNLPVAIAHVDRLVAQYRRLGRVPETDHGSGKRRLDIVAQLLRVGNLLSSHRGARGAPILPEDIVQTLSDELANSMAPDGAIPFVRDVAAPELNAWTTMFASQALTWTRLDARELALVAAEPLIV